MYFKRSGKYLFGVELTKDEQRIIDEEVEKQCQERISELVIKAEDNIDAQVLWFLHRRLGMTPEELKQAYYDFAEDIRALISYYEMEERDGSFICNEKLKAIGVDIQELKKGSNV